MHCSFYPLFLSTPPSTPSLFPSAVVRMGAMCCYEPKLLFSVYLIHRIMAKSFKEGGGVYKKHAATGGSSLLYIHLFTFLSSHVYPYFCVFVYDSTVTNAWRGFYCVDSLSSPLSGDLPLSSLTIYTPSTKLHSPINVLEVSTPRTYTASDAIILFFSLSIQLRPSLYWQCLRDAAAVAMEPSSTPTHTSTRTLWPNDALRSRAALTSSDVPPIDLPPNAPLPNFPQFNESPPDVVGGVIDGLVDLFIDVCCHMAQSTTRKRHNNHRHNNLLNNNSNNHNYNNNQNKGDNSHQSGNSNQRNWGADVSAVLSALYPYPTLDDPKNGTDMITPPPQGDFLSLVCDHLCHFLLFFAVVVLTTL